MPPNTYRFADFELDRSAYQLRRKGRPVRIERIPLDLLFLLAERPGQLVTRDEIRERIWGKDVFFDTDNSINAAVWKIRQVLHDGVEPPRFVATVPTKGYRFVATLLEKPVVGSHRDDENGVRLPPSAMGRAGELSELRPGLADATAGRASMSLISGGTVLSTKENRAVPIRMLRPAGAEDRERTKRFVGRELERAEVRFAIDEAVGGRGRLLLFSGEPGIGKTCLADEAAVHAASRGMRVYWGRCFEGGGAPAYWPWIQVIRGVIADSESQNSRTLPADIVRMLPELAAEAPQAEAGDAEQLRFRLFDAVARLLRESASAQPITLVLDDLHEADVASLQLLKFVARAVHDTKVIFVGTYRDAEMRRSPERAAIIPDILRDGAQLPLSGLKKDEVARMVELRAQRAPAANFVADLFRTTAGNPLFIDGIIRVLAAEGRLDTALCLDVESFKLPEGARGMIRKRLAMLSSGGQDILAIAAVIGLEFELSLLARVGRGIPARFLDQVREGIETGLVTEIAQECYRFSHPLIREALYKELNAEGRSRLHLRIGETLESLRSSDVAPQLAQLAHHYRLGGNFKKAIDYSIAAGEEARVVFAHEETVRHWQLAVEMMEKMSYPGARQANLLEQLGYTEELAEFSLATAIGHFVRAVKLYEEHGDNQAAARVHARLGFDLSERYFAGADIPAALIHYKRAETILKHEPESLDLAHLYVSMAKTASYLMTYEDGLEWSKRAMEIAQRLKSEEVWALAAAESGAHLHFLGRQRESLDILSQASEFAQKMNSPHTGARVALLCGDYFLNLWDSRRAQECYLAELSKQRLVKQSHVRRTIEFALTESYTHTGDLEQLRQLRIKNLVWQRLAEGAWEEMASLLRKYTEYCRKTGNRHFAAENPFLARAMVWSGKPREARDLLIEGLAARSDDPHLTISMRPTLALAHTLLGAYDLAEGEVYLIRKELAKGENWRGTAGDPLRSEAVLAAARLRFDEAQVCFAKAIGTFTTYVLPWERADTLYWWGCACRKAGDHTQAAEKFDAAVEVYRSIGAGQPWIDRVEAERARARPSQFRAAKPGQRSA